MKYWKKEFCQSENPYESAFYRSQRHCIAVFKEIGNPKPGLYVAQVIDIVPLDDFCVQAIVGIDCFQHCKNEIVNLRRHRSPDPAIASLTYWFDPVFQSQEQGERFIEITEDEMKQLTGKTTIEK